MKKLSAIALLLLCALLLSGCGDNAGQSAANPTVSVSSGPESAAAPTSESTAEPTPEATAELAPEATAEPEAGVGQTLSELKESVDITVNHDITPQNGLSGYDSVPEDLQGVIYLSAWRWMGYVFTELEDCPELADFECVELSLCDISSNADVLVFWAEYQFLPNTDSDADFWNHGNTAPCKDREGWYRFTRQIALGLDGESWEVLTVGTGGVRADNYVDR